MIDIIMALKTDLNLDATLFSPSAISAQTNGFNETLMEIMSNGPKWYEVDVPRNLPQTADLIL